MLIRKLHSQTLAPLKKAGEQFKFGIWMRWGEVSMERGLVQRLRRVAENSIERADGLLLVIPADLRPNFFEIFVMHGEVGAGTFRVMNDLLDGKDVRVYGEEAYYLIAFLYRLSVLGQDLDVSKYLVRSGGYENTIVNFFIGGDGIARLLVKADRYFGILVGLGGRNTKYLYKALAVALDYPEDLFRYILLRPGEELRS